MAGLLDLAGSFRTEGKDYNYSIINGVTCLGKKITLVQCFSESLDSILDNLNEKISFVYLFENYHFESIKEIQTCRLSFRLSYLNEWANCKSFLSKSNDDGYQVNVKNPCEISIELNNELELILNIGGFEVNQNLIKNNIMIQGIVEVYYISLKSMSFTDILDNIRKLQQFMSLAMDVPINYFNVSLEIDQCEEEVRLIDSFSNSNDEEDYILFKRLFSLSDIIENPKTYISKWFENYDKLKRVNNIYFGSRFSESLFVEQKYVNLVNVAEGFQKNYYDPSRKTLNHRLKFLIEECKPIFEDGKYTEFDELVNKMVYTRNAFTHYDDGNKLSSNLLSNLELVHINYNLSQMIKYHYLRMIGFDQEFCLQVIKLKGVY